MSTENKPREFWIRFRIGENESTHQITDVSLNPLGNYKEDFRVIEYSAYEQLKSKLEIAKKALNTALNYLHWREDDLIGDDCIGDGKLTAAYKNRVSEIEQALKEINEG